MTLTVKEAKKMRLDDVNITVNANVYYYMHDNTPGLCVEKGNRSVVWSPVKFMRSEVVTPCSLTSALSDEIIDVSDVLCVSYKCCDGCTWC